MNDIAAQVRKIIAEQLGVDESAILPESRLMEDLNADSLDMAELVMKAEDEFSLSITDEDAGKIRTVGEMTAYVEAQKKDGDAAAAA